MLGAFHPTESLLARAVRKLKLTTKQTNKGYYKGTRSSNVGHFSYKPKRYYIYEIDYAKVRTFVKPEGIEDHPLTPFVANRVQVPVGNKKKLTGKEYLQLFKDTYSDIRTPKEP